MSSSPHRRDRAFSASSYGSSSDEAIPAMQTAHFNSGAGRSPSPSSDTPAASSSTQSTEDGDNVDRTAALSSAITNDQERQVLLLMLLAQVCALHDPTPKTFTVHVLELFERGILDRESIHFLFELGLVPSTIPARGMLTNGPVTPFSVSPEATPAANCFGDETEISSMATHGGAALDLTAPPALSATTTVETTMATATTTELAMTTTPTATTMQSTHFKTTTSFQAVQSLRSMEAKAIRRQLSEHDFPDKKFSPTNCNPRDKSEHNTATSANDTSKTWDVEHFPLSLSRYQREFEQLSVLNSGSFGTVFHAIRKLDGCDYAMKKVTFDSVGYSNESIQRVIREVQCIAKVSEHPNIVRYYTSWLEPSWMTGGSGNGKNSRQQQQLKQLQYDANHNASPQKLLKDIEELLDSTNNDEKIEEYDYNGSSSFSASSQSSSDSSEEEESSFAFSRRRRSSWGGSSKSIDESTWSSYHSHEIEPWADVYARSGPTRKQQTSKKSTNKGSRKPKQYKYQVSLFIQMQLCHPATLQDWLRERNRQIPESNHAIRMEPAMEIFRQICSGLAHVHDNHIVHRDLKPNNIFVSKDGKVIKIGDFGLSKQLHEISHPDMEGEFTPSAQSPPTTSQADSSKSHPTDSEQGNAQLVAVARIGAVSSNAIVKVGPPRRNEPLTAGIGTASYAAPEQVKSKNYGTSADIFSLGLIFLELVCCFETEHERLHNFQQCRNQKVPSWLEDQYPHLARIILACTRPAAKDRPSAQELLDLSKSPASPKASLEVQLLKGQLLEKDRQLAEKNEMIADMKLEMERMKASLLPTTDASSGERVAFENAPTFDEDE